MFICFENCAFFIETVVSIENSSNALDTYTVSLTTGKTFMISANEYFALIDALSKAKIAIDLTEAENEE